MLSLLKAAPVAAISLTLLSVASYSDAGLAFGASNADTQLASDTIKIDTEVLAADAASREAALKPANDQIVFTPGTGDYKFDMPKSESQPENGEEDAREPAMPSASSLAALVKSHGAAGELDAETRCLAGAVYFESKGESLAGQLAVARVVLARTKSGRFPSSICGVVYQPSQFSFVRGGKMPRIDMGSQHWRNAVAISRIALDGSWKSPVEGALFFHARYVSPGWKLKRMGTIDNHVFYR
jgi:spore germination cell wall hydrolase CwlJ-like protein